MQYLTVNRSIADVPQTGVNRKLNKKKVQYQMIDYYVFSDWDTAMINTVLK